MSKDFAQALRTRIESRRLRLTQFMNYVLSGDYVNKYVYVSHHKCATQWTLSILRDVCALKKIPAVKCDWRERIRQSTLLWNKFIMIQDHSSHIIDIDTVRGRGFHVIRDPRDILVSMYFSHKNSHVVSDPRAGEILQNRALLSKADKGEGLLYLMEHSEYFGRVMREIERWDYDRENYYETKFETLTARPLDEFAEVFAFLGLSVDRSALRDIIERNTFSTMKRRWDEKHPDQAGSHYRKGRAGDWENHLQGTIREVFKHRYGGLLIRLGYEQDRGW
jgi:hypothetical protein